MLHRIPFFILIRPLLTESHLTILGTFKILRTKQVSGFTFLPIPFFFEKNNIFLLPIDKSNSVTVLENVTGVWLTPRNLLLSLDISGDLYMVTLFTQAHTVIRFSVDKVGSSVIASSVRKKKKRDPLTFFLDFFADFLVV